MLQHDRNITRIQAGIFNGRSWTKAASMEIRIVGFRKTGMYPFNPNKIPRRFFASVDSSQHNAAVTCAPFRTFAICLRNCATGYIIRLNGGKN
jgi:hypothetical protein